jgi:hypothetical protein
MEPAPGPSIATDLLQDISAEVFNRFRQTLNYGLEEAPVNPSDDLDNVLRAKFFSDLYVGRKKDEAEVLAWMTTHAHDLGLVVGVQGCGKSTLVKRVELDLDPDLYPLACINVRMLYDESLCQQPPNEWHRAIEQELKGWITERYFPADRIDKYFGHFLYEDPRANRFFLLERGLLHRKFIDSQTAARTGETEQAWFIRSQPNLVDICNRVDRSLTLYHYLTAARLAAGGQIIHFVLVLDNVDGVPPEYQPDLYAIAGRLREAYAVHANVVIVTRWETSYPPVAMTNGATPIVRLGLYDPDATQARLIPEADFVDIMRRRVALFEREHRGTQGVSELVQLSERLAHNLRPVRGEGRIFQLLANQSVRDALHYHVEFLRHALTYYKASDLVRLFGPPKSAAFIRSFLFGWLTSYGEVAPRIDFNVVGLLRACRATRFQTPGTDIAYATLAFAYNYRRASGSNPTVFELLERFRPLGFDEATILDAVYRLTDLRKTETGMIMTLYQRPLPTSGRDIKPTAMIEPNYRGELLLNQVVLSFMFITRLLYSCRDDSLYSKQARSKVPPLQFYDAAMLSTHCVEHTRFLFGLADLHVLELHRIRNRDPRRDWLRNYERWFCWQGQHQVERAVGLSERYFETMLLHGSLNDADQQVVRKCMGLQQSLVRAFRAQVDALAETDGRDVDVLDFHRLYEAGWEDPDSLEDTQALLVDKRWKRDIASLLNVSLGV